MDGDSGTAYFAAGLGQDASNVPMTPPATGYNLDFMSWGVDDGSLPSPGYPPATRPSAEGFFDDLDFSDAGFGTSNAGYALPVDPLFKDWARRDSVPLPLLAPLSMPGPAASAEPSFFEANGRVANLSPSAAHDDFLVSPVSPVSSVSSIEQIKRTGSADGSSVSYHSPEPADETRYPQPAKRIRSHASDGAEASRPTAAGRKAPSSPETKKPTGAALSKSAPTTGGGGVSGGVVKRRPKRPTPNHSYPTPAGGGEGVKTQLKTQLRTAQRRAKPTRSAPPPPAAGGGLLSDEEPDDPLAPEERRARESHNLVEKQYRSRLNQQFESLLAVLPAGKHVGIGSGSRSGQGNAGAAAAVDDRRLSKAEVLERARRRIEDLEEYTKRLVLEKEGLLGNIELMRGVVGTGATG